MIVPTETSKLTCAFLFFYSLGFFAIVSSVHGQCMITPATDLKLDSPVMLDNEFNFMYPNHEHPNDLHFKWFQDRLLYCPGSGLDFNGKSLQLFAKTPDETFPPVPPSVRCISDKTFMLEIDTNPKDLVSKLKCTKEPEVVDWLTDKTCGEGRVFDLGFGVGPKNGKTLIQACYADEEATTLWSHTILRQAVNGNSFRKSTNPTDVSSYFPGNLFQDVSVKDNYQTCQQTARFVEMFWEKVQEDSNQNPSGMSEMQRQAWEANIQAKGEEFAKKYIKLEDNPKNYLVPGQLVPSTHLYYAIEQTSSFFFVNTLPVWGSVWSGNWGKIQEGIKQLAKTKGDLEVWSGGLGRLEIEGSKVYLGRPRVGHTQKTMPVPKVLFSLVHSKQFNQAIVFVVINNPYMKPEEQKNYGLCNEHVACRNIPEYADIEKGVIYCCQALDFLGNTNVQKLGIHTEIPPDVTPIM